MPKGHTPITDTHCELALNSFVRRTQNTNQLKALIETSGGTLRRLGRSRNWKILVPNQNKKNLIDHLYQANEPSWLWLAKLLAEQKVNYQSEDLIAIVKKDRSMTAQELVSLSDCTLTEARKILDEVEWQEE